MTLHPRATFGGPTGPGQQLEDSVFRERKLKMFGRLVAKVGRETPLARPESSHGAGGTKNQPWRPHLSPLVGQNSALTTSPRPVSRPEGPFRSTGIVVQRRLHQNSALMTSHRPISRPEGPFRSTGIVVQRRLHQKSAFGDLTQTRFGWISYSIASRIPPDLSGGNELSNPAEVGHLRLV